MIIYGGDAVKKIERIQIEPVMIKGRESEGCIVHEKDLDTLEAELEKHQWISVKDRLPNYKFEIFGKRFVNVLVTDGKEGDEIYG